VRKKGISARRFKEKKRPVWGWHRSRTEEEVQNSARGEGIKGWLELQQSRKKEVGKAFELLVNTTTEGGGGKRKAKEPREASCVQ